MTKSLTASSVHSAMMCSWPFRPGVKTVERPSGPAAELGNAVHAGVEAVLLGKETGLEPGSDAARHVEQAMTWLRSFGPPPQYIEQGFVYDVRNDRARLGPRRGEPGYGRAASGCIVGTTDWVWTTGSTLVVVDLKTGRKPEHREQLYIQALAMGRALGLTKARVGYCMSRLTKHIPPEWEELDEDAFDSFAGQMHRLVRLLPVAQPQPWEGCRYCSVDELDCPAINGSLRSA